jgi:hypothetical protein
MKTRNLASLVVLLLVLTCAFAAEKPDFSGEWKLNTEKSDFGPLPGPSKATEKTTHKEPKLHVIATGVADQGEYSAEFDFTTDGQECKNSFVGNEMTSTVTWEGNRLVLKSKINFPGLEVTSEERWSLSDDGTVLTKSVHLSSDMGVADQTVIFEKQQ